GISGPAILQISSYWQPGDDLRLALLPALDVPAWLAPQQRGRPDAALRSVLADVLPRRFGLRLGRLWLRDRAMKELSPARLREAAATLAGWPRVAGGAEGDRTAEDTLGGVDTDGLSSSTMMSRRVPGLYF